MEPVPDIAAPLDVIFAVEGHHAHHCAPVPPGTTVRAFTQIAITATGIDELVEVFVENGDDPLDPDLVIIEHLSVEFAPLHVGKHGKVQVTVRYQNRPVEHAFRPAATIDRITTWAMQALGLHEDPVDFQLKHEGKVLAPDMHLGQVVKGTKTAAFDLVFKIKPQG